MKRKKKDSDKNTTLEKDISAKLLIVSFVRVKIHQYTSFKGTLMQIWKSPYLIYFIYSRISAITGSIRSSLPQVFLWKGFLEIFMNFTGEQPFWSVISIKLQSNVTIITLWRGCSLVILVHISRIPFHRNTSGWLLLKKNIRYVKTFQWLLLKFIMKMIRAHFYWKIFKMTL